MLIEAKNIIYWRTLWHLNSTFSSSLSASSAYHRFTKNEISFDFNFSPHSASISRILEPIQQVLKMLVVMISLISLQTIKEIGNKLNSTGPKESTFKKVDQNSY